MKWFFYNKFIVDFNKVFFIYYYKICVCYVSYFKIRIKLGLYFS